MLRLKRLKMAAKEIKVMISLYNSFVLPHLEYCSLLLLGVGKVQPSRLEDVNFLHFEI